MIEEMRIRDVGVIAEAVVELSPRLTVLTGETGAGKTMVLTGLGLLCGSRADANRVRTGRATAVVEGRMRLAPGHPAREAALELGAELDEDGTLLVSRTVRADGRSRAVVGGQAVPTGVLARLMADVVAVHGQRAQSGLLRPQAAREALDKYAGVAGPLGDGLYERYVAEYTRWRAALADLDDRVARARERARESDLLRLGLADITKVAPQPGEVEELAQRAATMAYADELRRAATGARAALAGEPGEQDALSQLGTAQRVLASVAQHDPTLSDYADRARELTTLAADLASDLSTYADRLDADPEALEAVEERRAALRHLTRRYGDTVDDVLTWADEASVRLAELDDSDEALALLRTRCDELAQSTGGLAAQLHDRRVAAATDLSRAVGEELGGLSMGSAQVVVDVRPRAPEVPRQRDRSHPAGEAATTTRQDRRVISVADVAVTCGPDGGDEVALLVSPGGDATPRPLAKVASGGELSRVMLALEVSLARVTGTPVMVFDEVDAGIGGAVALEVGARLARLAAERQVVTVTHLAQVAAYADRHLVVTKAHSDAVTTSDVRTVADSERVTEIARMLGGLADSGSGREHAEELLGLAGWAVADA